MTQYYIILFIVSIKYGDVKMYKKNDKHLQMDIFGGDPFALKDTLKDIEDTEEYFFYKTIFCNLNEDLFAPLYCADNGRVNSAVNVMVCGLFLKEKLNLSYKQFFKQLKYNLLLRVSLGLFSLGTKPFCPATIFNFINLVKDYEDEKGINLFEQVFKELTSRQLADLEIKMNIARTDSFMVDSNIRSYSRLQLLIEVLLRFNRVFSASDKKLFSDRFTDYEEKGSEHYIYDIKGSDLSHEKTKVAEAYLWINTFIADKYNSTEEYKIFCRVYSEQFKIDESNKLLLLNPKEVSSNSLQSPDDPDATFRKKREEEYHGQVASVTETVDPDKKDINLIIDIAVSPNNVDDSKIFNKRLDVIVEMVPEVEEIHFDGGYGSAENDKKMDELNINPIQTAVRGRKPSVEMEIEVKENNEIIVTCPFGQKILAKHTDTAYKACFNLSICQECSKRKKCPVFKSKNPAGTYYFNKKDILLNKRNHNIRNLPLDRRKCRAPVESTMNEFVHLMQGHKLKVRGAFKASLFAFSMGVMINFGRIYRHYFKNNNKKAAVCLILIFIQEIKSIFTIFKPNNHHFSRFNFNIKGFC